MKIVPDPDAVGFPSQIQMRVCFNIPDAGVCCGLRSVFLALFRVPLTTSSAGDSRFCLCSDLCEYLVER